MKEKETEYWLSGPLPDIEPMLQPVAHALLQAQREILELMETATNDLLWRMPAGVASPAFHLQHIVGVLDRLFTYANNNQLSEEQLIYLSNEGKRNNEITIETLLETLQSQMKKSIDFLQKKSTETLVEVRYVGRKKIASTQLSLLFHAAEHTMRHTGQLMVTMKIISTAN